MVNDERAFHSLGTSALQLPLFNPYRLLLQTLSVRSTQLYIFLYKRTYRPICKWQFLFICVSMRNSVKYLHVRGNERGHLKTDLAYKVYGLPIRKQDMPF